MSPNQPKTPASAFRLPDDVKAALTQTALERGVTQTSIVVAALRKHLRLPAPDKDSPKP